MRPSEIEEHAFIMNVKLGLDGSWLKVTRRFCDFLGYSREELTSMTLQDITHPDDLEKSLEALESLKKGEKDVTELKKRYRHKQGEVKWAYLNIILATDENNKPLYYEAYLQDITEQKKAREELEQQVYINNKILNTINVGYVLTEFNGDIKKVNPSYCDMVGYSEEELLSMNISELQKDLKNGEKEELVKRASREGKIQIETSHERKDGSHIDLDVSLTTVRSEGKRLVAGFARDISEQKVTMRKLRESEQRWQRLVENNPLCVVLHIDRKIEFINQAGAELFGAESPEKIAGRTIFEFIPRQYEDRAEDRLSKVDKAEKLPPDEQEIQRLDGGKAYVLVHSVPVTYEGERAIQSVLQDITDLKKFEQKLKQKNEEWNKTFNSLAEAIIILDGKDRSIIECNEATEEILGYSKDELIGESVRLLHIDEEKFQSFKEDVERNVSKRGIFEAEYKLKKKDGNIIDTDHTITTIKKDEDEIERIVSVVRDITERKEQENIIRQSLKEKEVLLQEIHHRVKNNLAVISGMLELQTMNSENEHAVEALRESQMRIYSMAMIHEKLYQSDSFSNIGFEEYIQDLVETIRSTHAKEGRKISINYNLDSVALNINEAIPCALIINELIVNCLKHAFAEADSGEININLQKKVNKVILRVLDDGKGLPEDFDIKSQQSLGMTLIQTFSDQLEGEIKFGNRKGQNGAEFELRFNLNSQ